MNCSSSLMALHLNNLVIHILEKLHNETITFLKMFLNCELTVKLRLLFICVGFF